MAASYPLLEISYSDGRWRRIHDDAFVAGGEAATTVIDIGFDSLEEGLVVYYLHYEPMRPDERALDVARDPRGLPCRLYNDAFAVVIRPEDMAGVDRVYYQGKPRLFRFERGGDLVNLSKVMNAQALFLDDEGNGNVRILIADLFDIMCARYRSGMGSAASDEEVKARVCSDLGVTGALVDDCIEFRSYRRLAELDEGGGGAGEWVDDFAPIG